MNIFSLPQIVIEKVGLSEILDILRESVNKGYMPSASGAVKYNTKPEYTQFELEGFPDYPQLRGQLNDGHGYGEYVAFDSFEVCKTKAIFFYLKITNIEIYINLQTDEALIKLFDDPVFMKWDNPDNKIPIMRDELRRTIEIYA